MGVGGSRNGGSPCSLARALKGFDVDDLVAAREYMEAYVSFFKYAEGHDHDHQHAHAH